MTHKLGSLLTRCESIAYDMAEMTSPRWAQLMPDIRYPIVSAPMANVADADLAIAVSRAGGLGLIGGGYDVSKLAAQFDKVRAAGVTVGLGIITFAVPADRRSALFDTLAEYADVVKLFWLFGGDEAEVWLPAFFEHFDGKPRPKTMVQVHGVQEAVRCVAAGAEAIVAQGSDAGGHGGAHSSSILGLVPEFVDHPEIGGRVPVLAAGGISDGRGVLAAFALGAVAVVVGTRFMITHESKLAQPAKELAAATRDGGQKTVQTRVYDEMRGTTDWPVRYTGRAIANDTFRDHVAAGNTETEEMRTLYKEAMQTGDYSRLVCWAGTAVGLANAILPAGEVVANLVKEYHAAKANLV